MNDVKCTWASLAYSHNLFANVSVISSPVSSAYCCCILHFFTSRTHKVTLPAFWTERETGVLPLAEFQFYPTRGLSCFPQWPDSIFHFVSAAPIHAVLIRFPEGQSRQICCDKNEASRSPLKTSKFITALSFHGIGTTFVSLRTLCWSSHIENLHFSLVYAFRTEGKGGLGIEKQEKLENAKTIPVQTLKKQTKTKQWQD